MSVCARVCCQLAVHQMSMCQPAISIYADVDWSNGRRPSLTALPVLLKKTQTNQLRRNSIPTYFNVVHRRPSWIHVEDEGLALIEC